MIFLTWLVPFLFAECGLEGPSAEVLKTAPWVLIMWPFGPIIGWGKFEAFDA